MKNIRLFENFDTENTNPRTYDQRQFFILIDDLYTDDDASTQQPNDAYELYVDETIEKIGDGKYMTNGEDVLEIADNVISKFVEPFDTAWTKDLKTISITSKYDHEISGAEELGLFTYRMSNEFDPCVSIIANKELTPEQVVFLDNWDF